MRKHQVIFMLVITFIPILSGCWNQKELTDIAFVMAMGVDKGTNNKNYDVTFQIVIPGNVSPIQSGGGQGLPVVVFKSSGNNLTEAVRKAAKSIPRQLYFAHTNIFVISEEIAREGMLDLLDGLDRDPVFRTTTQIIIAKESSAEDLISTLSLIERLPANKVTKMLKTTEKMVGENLEVDIDGVISSIVSSGKEPVISGFIIDGKPEKGKSPDNLATTQPPSAVKADDLALFRDGKLIGWLSGERARGVLWVLNKIESTDVNLYWKGKKAAISMITKKSQTKLSASIKNGKPVIRVLIKSEGNLSEANTAIDVMNPKKIGILEEKIEKEVKKQVEDSIKAAQKQKSDIFGFGEVIHRTDPKLWKKLKNNWNEQFAQLEVHVEVEAFYRRAGVRTTPFWNNMNK